MRERPKQSACHDRAERNDPYAGHLLENEEVAIRTQAGAAVEEQELLAVKKKKKRREDTKKKKEKKKSIFNFKNFPNNKFLTASIEKDKQHCREKNNVPERARACFHNN